MYAPVVGRWLSRDPLTTGNGGIDVLYSDEYVARRFQETAWANVGENAYEYGGSNPVNRADPSGLVDCLLQQIITDVGEDGHGRATIYRHEYDPPKRCRRMLEPERLGIAEEGVVIRSDFSTFTLYCDTKDCEVDCSAVVSEINTPSGGTLVITLPAESPCGAEEVRFDVPRKAGHESTRVICVACLCCLPPTTACLRCSPDSPVC